MKLNKPFRLFSLNILISECVVGGRLRDMYAKSSPARCSPLVESTTILLLSQRFPTGLVWSRCSVWLMGCSFGSFAQGIFKIALTQNRLSLSPHPCPRPQKHGTCGKQSIDEKNTKTLIQQRFPLKPFQRGGIKSSIFQCDDVRTRPLDASPPLRQPPSNGRGGVINMAASVVICRL